MYDMKRSRYPDVVKGVAILLVVLGHNIQYGSGEDFYQQNMFFENKLFQFIYSFHMPLFIIISGYFFANTVTKYKAAEVIKDKAKTLLVPIAVWSMIPFGVGILSFDFSGENLFGRLVALFTYSFLNNLWFLWGVLYCSALTLFVYKFCRDSLWIYLFIGIAPIVLPNAGKIFLYAYLFPYFVLGYLYRRWGMEEKVIRVIRGKWCFPACIVAVLTYAVCLCFYNEQSFIYTSGISILGENGVSQIGIDIFRWVIGLLGTLLVLYLVFCMHDKVSPLENALVYLGQQSMGIYIIDIFASNSVLLLATKSLGLHGFTLFIETIGMLMVCVTAVFVIGRIPLAKRMLFGGR